VSNAKEAPEWFGMIGEIEATRRNYDRYVIVCFSLNKKNALLYRDSSDPDVLANYLRKCVEMGADVISIRKYLSGQAE